MSAIEMGVPAGTESKEGPSLTQQLAKFVVGLQYEAIPPDAVRHFKRMLMDCLAAGVAGSQTPPTIKLLATLKHVAGSGSSDGSYTVWGHRDLVARDYAALLNGTSSHGLDIDDGHTKGSVHIGCSLFPALFATAESLIPDPKRLVAASVAGFDVTARISAAMHPHSRARGFHNTGTAGVFGAAAAVGRALDLDHGQMTHALGMAASFASGLMAFFYDGHGATDIKRVHAGKAGRDGLLAAFMAREGLQGPVLALEGKNGFFQAYANQVDLDFVTSELGTRFEITNMYVKPYPACRSLHGPIEAILRLRERESLRPEQVKSIDVATYAFASNRSRTDVTTWGDAQFSIPFALAFGLVFGQVGTSEFTDENVARPDVRDLASRVRVRRDDVLDAAYPVSRPAVVDVELTDGRHLAERIDYPYGEPQNPVPDAEVERKFLVNAGPVLGVDRCKKIAELIWDFENLPGIHVLMPLLRKV